MPFTPTRLSFVWPAPPRGFVLFGMVAPSADDSVRPRLTRGRGRAIQARRDGGEPRGDRLAHLVRARLREEVRAVDLADVKRRGQRDGVARDETVARRDDRERRHAEGRGEGPGDVTEPEGAALGTRRAG